MGAVRVPAVAELGALDGIAPRREVTPGAARCRNDAQIVISLSALESSSSSKADKEVTKLPSVRQDSPLRHRPPPDHRARTGPLGVPVRAFACPLSLGSSGAPGALLAAPLARINAL